MTRSRLQLRALMLCVIAALSAGSALAATQTPSTWRSEYGDASNTGYNPSESALDVAAVKNLSASWSTWNPGMSSFTPVVGVNRVLIPCPKGMCALDRAGVAKWSAPSPGIPSPAIADGVVFATVQSHPVILAAMSAADGSELWRRTFPNTGSMYASPLWFDGTLYASTDSGDLYALNAATGGVRWSKRFEFSSSVPVAITQSRIYAVSRSDNSRLQVLRRDTGALLWTGRSQYAHVGAPAVGHGKVYVSSIEEGLLAYDADGCGRALCDAVWAPYTPDDGVPFSVAVGPRRIFTVDEGARIRAYGAESGALLWTGSARGHNPAHGVTRPVVANGVVYVGDGLRLRAFRASGCADRSCAPLWTHIVSNDQAWPYRGLAVADGSLYGVANFRLERFKPLP